MSLNSDNKDFRMPPPVVAHCIIQHWIIDPENSPKDSEHYIFTSSPASKSHQWLVQVSTKLLPVELD